MAQNMVKSLCGSCVIVGGWLVAGASPAGAATVAYWRMEADADAGATISIVNEAGGSSTPLTDAVSAVPLATVTADVPGAAVPLTQASNTNSLDPGDGSTPGLSASHYAALNLVGSATVEFWVKTEDALGIFVSHSGDNASGNSHQANTRGFTIHVNGGTLYAKYRVNGDAS